MLQFIAKNIAEKYIKTEYSNNGYTITMLPTPFARLRVMHAIKGAEQRLVVIATKRSFYCYNKENINKTGIDWVVFRWLFRQKIPTEIVFYHYQTSELFRADLLTYTEIIPDIAMVLWHEHILRNKNEVTHF